MCNSWTGSYGDSVRLSGVSRPGTKSSPGQIEIFEQTENRHTLGLSTPFYLFIYLQTAIIMQ